MPGIIISEAGGRLKTLYGDYQAPIASCIEDTAKAWEAKQIGLKLFAERPSNHFAEGYTALTGIGDWEPTGENGAHPVTDFTEAYDKIVQNVTWKNSFSISREMRDDNMIGDMMKRARKLTDSFYATREKHLARMLGVASKGETSFQRGGQTFSTTAADGLCVFSKAHKNRVTGETQSNVTGKALDAEALAEAMTAMQNMTDDKGEIMALCPDTLLIPNIAALKQAAFAIVGSEKVPGSGNNDYNYLFGNLDVIVWPYLNQYIDAAETAPWFLLDRSFNENDDGAVYQNRVEPEITSRLGSNDENIWDGYSRWAAEFINWRFIYGGGLGL